MLDSVELGKLLARRTDNCGAPHVRARDSIDSIDGCSFLLTSAQEQEGTGKDPLLPAANIPESQSSIAWYNYRPNNSQMRCKAKCALLDASRVLLSIENRSTQNASN